MPFTAQVTAVFDIPVTEDTNCCDNPRVTETLAGVTVTTGVGTIITFADADLVGSAILLTITLTLACGGAMGGAI